MTSLSGAAAESGSCHVFLSGHAKFSMVTAAHLSQFLSLLPFHINKAGNFWSFLSSLYFLIVSNTIDRIDKMKQWGKTLAMFVRNLTDGRKKEKSYNVKCDFFVTRYSILVIILTDGMRNTCHILTLSYMRLCGLVVNHRRAGAEGLRFASLMGTHNFLSFSTLVTWRKIKPAFFSGGSVTSQHVIIARAHTTSEPHL